MTSCHVVEASMYLLAFILIGIVAASLLFQSVRAALRKRLTKNAPSSSGRMLTQQRFYELLREKRPSLITLQVLQWPTGGELSEPVRRFELRFETPRDGAFRTHLDRSQMRDSRNTVRPVSPEEMVLPTLNAIVRNARWNAKRNSAILSNPTRFLKSGTAD